MTAARRRTLRTPGEALRCPGMCRRAIVLARYIQSEPEVQLLIDQLRLTVLARPPPKITAHGSGLTHPA